MKDSDNRGIFKEITLVNIIVFVITFGGAGFLANLGGNSYLYTLKHFQLYRLFTCIFIHYGILHILGNTISLYILDILTTGLINRKDKFFIYFSTGIISSIASAFINMLLSRDVISAGASGAICGLIGALVAIIHGKRTGIKSSILFLLIPFIFFIGFKPGVDNVAHIAGMVSGFVIYKTAYGSRI